MSADELIYKVKLEQDLKSFRDVEKALEDIERKARGTGGGGGRRGGRGGSAGGTEQEVSALKELRGLLKQNREDLAELNKMKRDGVVLSNEFSTAQDDTIANIRTLSSQIQEATRGYADQETAINSTATTYNQLTAQNRALSIAMRDLPLNDTTGRLEELQERYSQNNAKLKEFDASMGNFQRNVGNYTGGLRSFASSLAVIQGPLGPIAGRLNALATTIDKVRAMTGGATESTSILSKVLSGNIIPLIKTSADAMKGKAVAVGVANGAIRGLNFTLALLSKALIATGVGALAIALVSVIQAFKRTEEGAEKLRVIMAGFGAITEVLLDRLSALGRGIIKAFEDPKQAISDLSGLIMRNLVNRVTALPKIFSEAFGSMSKGLQAAGMAVKGIWSDEAREASRTLFAEAKQDAIDFTGAVGQLLTGIEEPFSKLADNASKITAQIEAQASARRQRAEEMNAVLRAERELSVERAQQNRDLQKSREFARQLDEDAQTRLKNLKEEGELERQQSQKEIALQSERLRIMKALRDLSDTDAKTKDEIAQQEVKLANLERESSERRMKLLRDINTVERQIREENLRRERTTFELTQRNLDLGFAKTRDILIEEGRLTEALRNDLVRLEREAEADKARNRQVFLAEFLNQKFSQEEAERLATEKAEIESQEAIYKARKSLNDQLRKERIDTMAFDRDIALQREQMMLSFERDRLIRQGRLVEAESLQEIDQKKVFAKIWINEFQKLREQGVSEEEAERRANEIAQIQSEQIVADAKRRIMNADLEQRINNANLAANAIGAINNAFFNSSKEIAVAKAIIDTYAGANSAFAETKAGIEGKILAAGIAIANGFANVKKILATKIGDKSVSRTASSAPSVRTSFGLVSAGTNRQNFAFDTATMAQSATSKQMSPQIVLSGEFDPAFLAVKVTMGNNQISSQATGF